MNWEQLLSLKRYGDKYKRLRREQDETRLGFEVDYDRIIFSPAFRSLQDKTQVIPLSKTGFVHTRLTHSLEVSVVGRSLGRIVGKEILKRHPHLESVHGHHFNDFGAIVAAAALAHDIGNPPFGHSGEKIIGDYFKRGKGKRFKDQLSEAQYHDLIKFEGNANGFKLLTESRNGTDGGLRLSYATLGAFIKYPKASLPTQPSSHIAHKKFGFFQTEKENFEEIAHELGLQKSDHDWNRHPLAFLVEAADDICYTIIDFEDGINLGLIEEEFALENLIRLVENNLNKQKYRQLSTTKDRLGYLRSLAINTLIEEAVEIFLSNEQAIMNGEFEVSLLKKSSYTAQIEDILELSKKKIYRSKEVMGKEIAGHAILLNLLHTFTKAFENKLNDDCSHYDRLIMTEMSDKTLFQPTSVYSGLLEICCFIASLTDGVALREHKKLSGMGMEF